MKKALIIFSLFVLAIACKDKVSDTANITNVVVPESSVTAPLVAGTSITILGNGFTATSQIYFQPNTKATTSGVLAKIVEVTGSSITVIAPQVVGSQTIVLNQDGKEQVLGTVEFGVNENYATYPLSTKTAGQEKELLIAEANSNIAKMNGLTETKAYLLMRSFDHYLSLSDSGIIAPVQSTSDLIYCNSFYGTFTWNNATQSWAKTDDATKLTFVFPATIDGTSNNARIEVTGESSDLQTDQGYVLPKSMNANFFADNNNVGSIVVAATNINATTFASTASITYNMNPYTLVFNAAKNTDNMNVASLKLTKGSDVIIDGSANLAGVLDNNLSDTSFQTGNTTIKIGDDYVIAGTVNVGALSSALTAIDNQYSSKNNPEHMYSAPATTAAYKENINMFLASRTRTVRVAKVGFRTNEDHLKTPTEYGVFLTLEFGDGSSVDGKVYFGAGFESVVEQWNTFMARFNN